MFSMGNHFHQAETTQCVGAHERRYTHLPNAAAEATSYTRSGRSASLDPSRTISSHVRGDTVVH